MPNFDIQKKIVDLKIAAIDAYMYNCESSFASGARHWVRSGDNYEVKFGLLSDNSSWKVTTPGFDGEGGGELIGPSLVQQVVTVDDKPSTDFASKFNEIRKTIETALDPWYPDFPHGDPIAEQSNIGWHALEPIRTEDYTLPMSINNPSKRASANTNLTGDLNQINGALGAMNGLLIDQVEDFLGKLEGTIGNIAALGSFWNSSLCVESQIVSSIREAVEKAVDEATSVCKQIAAGGTGITFKVALDLLAAVGGLVTASSGVGAAGAAASLTSAYITLKESDDVQVKVEESNGKSTGEGVKTVSTAEEALSHFDHVLTAINTKMKNAEDSINNQLKAEWDNVHDKTQQNYVIKLKPIDNVAQEVIINRAEVDKITNVLLPNVTSILNDSCSKIGEVSMSKVAYRAGAAGKFHHGPSGSFENLRETIQSLLRNLAWQTSEAAANLHAAAGLIEGTDANAQAELNKTTTDISSGSGVDPWRKPHPNA